MLEFYKHKTDKRFFYTKYTNGVYESYVDHWEKEFYKFSQSDEKYIGIFDYENGYLVDKEFYTKSAKISKKLGVFFTDSAFVGLKGIQKMFYKLYVQLAPGNGIKRHVLNEFSEVEVMFNIKKEDFTLIASYDEER